MNNINQKYTSTLNMANFHQMLSIDAIRGYHFNVRSDMTRRIRLDIIDEDLPVLMTHRECSLARLYQVLQEHDVVQHIRGLSDAD